jgi:hypothetical protein
MNVRARRTATLATIALAASAMLSSGCEGIPGNYPGGSQASIDRFTYTSTTDLPQSVSLIDTRSGQTVWSKDIPVGRQLVLRFTPVESRWELTEPDRMNWAIMEIGRFGTDALSEELWVPPANARRLDISYRAPGELPPPPVEVQDAPPPLAEPAPEAPTSPPPPAAPASAAPGQSQETAPPIDLQDD